MLIVGMGGTLVTLYLLTLIIKGVTKLFPVDNSKSGNK